MSRRRYVSQLSPSSAFAALADPHSLTAAEWWVGGETVDGLASVSLPTTPGSWL